MNPTSKPSSSCPSTTTTEEQGGATTKFSLFHPDIIESHILTRLDGPSLAAASCSSATLHHLSSQEHLWSHICHSTWPSTTSPRVSRLISTFPNGGPRAFFVNSYPLPLPEPTSRDSRSSPPPELISAVDISYRNKLIFSKVEETETVTGWFRCSPFRIDLLEPKEVVPTPIKHTEGDDTCTSLIQDMTLSWILIDPIGRRAVSLSSHKPVSVQRHWLTGEVQVRFASILAADQKGATRGHVQCGIVVTCGKSEGGEMQVREVSMEMEDMDGMHLIGRDSLVVLHKALEGKRGKAINREDEGRRRYKEYVEMKRERKERKQRTEGALDVLCVAFGVSIFVAFWCFVWWRWL
ncbi:hypothetical protein ACH5RR_005646 [Cinchona calisaya]|uniref:F-box protein n=1 Tax=Cinchona calisaya TaxID=153742 RepID=A0ABD3ALT1_9GENT